MTIREVLGRDPYAKFFVAPRHPSRFLPFYERLKKQFGNATLYSDLQNSNSTDSRVCLVNKMGILSDLFRVSKIAILAGSFDASIRGT